MSDRRAFLRMPAALIATALLGLISVQPSTAISAEQQRTVTVDDYLGCWISTEPAGLTIETDLNKPDGYIELVESMMLAIERVNDKPEFRDLVKGAFDIWSDAEKTLIPTQYYNGVFNPVAGSIIQGAPGQGNSTIYVEGDKLIYIHHKAAENSSHMSLRNLGKIDCKAMAERRTRLQETYKLLQE